MIPKYRAWQKELKAMVGVACIHWTMVHTNEINEICIYFPEEAQKIIKEKDDYNYPLWYAQQGSLRPKHFGDLSDLILMQSTGLKDIFQDDIVSFSLISDPETAHIGVVFYDQTCLGWMIRSSTIPTSIEENEIFYPTGMVSMALILQGYVESIGNIHANPGLLEEKSDGK